MFICSALHCVIVLTLTLTSV